VEENGRRGPINTDESLDPSIMYLIRPSYAEPDKQEIKHIIKNEKEKLCNNKLSKMSLKMLISFLLLLTAKILNKW
jgi:hypothetical protein